jgi:hypothetical protein
MDAADDDELNASVDGWRMDVATRIPWMILMVRMKSPAQGSDPEQAPPDVDELAEEYG